MNPIRFSLVLTIVFFAFMWIVFPFLNDLLLKQLTGLSKSVAFTSNSMGGQSNLVLKTALSFGMLPLLALGVFQLVKRFKNPGYPSRKLIMISSIISVSYLIGFFCKYIFLLLSLDAITSEPLSPNIQTDIPLSQVYYYDYALVFSVVSGLLMLLFAKKKTIWPM